MKRLGREDLFVQSDEHWSKARLDILTEVYIFYFNA
jgi:hypothetical protein